MGKNFFLYLIYTQKEINVTIVKMKNRIKLELNRIFDRIFLIFMSNDLNYKKNGRMKTKNKI